MIAVIANPAASGGRVGRDRAELERTLHAALGPRAHLRWTSGPGDGAAQAGAAIAEGATTVLALGGDGTLNEVLNGVLGARGGADVRLGLLPAGTGGDFARTLGIRSIADGLALAAAGATTRVNVGRASFAHADGAPTSRWFLNVASAGLGGAVDQRVARSRKRFGGTAAFLAATVAAMFERRAWRCRITIDGVAAERSISLVAACNGRFAGAGMMFAPAARLDDGLLDVVTIRATSLARMLLQTPRLYRGTHLTLPEVEHVRARVIEVAPADDDAPAPLDLDGEAPGVAPVRLEVVPAALSLLVRAPLVGA